MGTNYPTDDEPSTDRPINRTAVTDSVADVEPPGDYLDEFPRWRGGVDVVIPREIARAVAHRVGTVSARGKTVTERTVYDYALDHATVAERFLVPAADWRERHTPLAEWVAQQGVPVEGTDGDRRDGDSHRPRITATDDERSPTEKIVRAWQLLESVPVDELDDDTDSRVLTALEQLDSAVSAAVADGRLTTEGD